MINIAKIVWSENFEDRNQKHYIPSKKHKSPHLPYNGQIWAKIYP
jgi:hypothetical protein